MLEAPLRLNGVIPFEAIVGEVESHTGGLIPAFIDALFSRAGSARQNGHHEVAVALREAGLFECIITTNFDECLEAVPGSSDTPLNPQAPDAWEWRGEPLIKVHGSISTPGSLAATPTGLAVRAPRSPWNRSLVDFLEGRNVLFVGYGFNDFADITPALVSAAERGARYHWAHFGPAPPSEVPSGVVTLISTDLASPNRDILRLIGAQVLPGRTWTVDPTVKATLQTRSDAALAACSGSIRDGERLAARAALHYWVRDGRRATQYFRQSSAAVGSFGPPERRLIANSLLRWRRYRRAERDFVGLASDAARQPSSNATAAVVDLLCAAAFAAEEGGRHRQAHRHRMRVMSLLDEAGLRPETQLPYVADQVLRGTAEGEIKLALRSWTRSARADHLALATKLLDLVDRVQDLNWSIPHLVLRDRVRIVLADRRPAPDGMVAELLTVRSFFARYGDPDGVTTVDRLLAQIDSALYRDRLAEDARAAAARGHWLEWTKLVASRAGLGSHGRAAPILYRLADMLVIGSDIAFEVLHLATRERV